MIAAAFAWFMGSKIGRWLAAAAALALAILGALAAARRAGVNAARQEMEHRRMEAVRDRREVEEEVDALDDDDLRADLSEWVRGPDR